MSDDYDELIEGRTFLRTSPGLRHETICQRLHQSVAAAMVGHAVSQLLPPRSQVEISRQNRLRPDLALVTCSTNKL